MTKEELETLVDTLRSKGVRRFRDEHLEIELGPEPTQAQPMPAAVRHQEAESDDVAWRHIPKSMRPQRKKE